MFKAINKQVDRTRNWIFNALLSLLGKKPYDEIKIANITEEAGVARQSFYRNYDSKDDIIYKFVSGIILEYAKRLKGLLNAGDITHLQTLEEFFKVFLEKKDELLRIKNASLTPVLLNAFWNFFFELSDISEALEKEKMINQEAYMRYQLGGFISVVVWWINGDMERSPAQMADTALVMMENESGESAFIDFVAERLRKTELI